MDPQSKITNGETGVRTWTGRWLRAMIGIATAVIIIAGIRAAESLLVPVLLAVFLAAVLHPLVVWLERRRLPLGLAVLITIVLILVAFSGPGLLVQNAAQTFAASVPTYRTDVERALGPLVERLATLGFIEFDWQSLIDPGGMLDLVRALSAGVAALLGNTLVILLMTAFMLLEGKQIRPRLQRAFDLGPDSLEALDDSLRDVQRYLRLKTVISLATGITIGLWLSALGVENALLWGLLAFILNFIPNFGSLIAAIPPAVLVLVQDGPGLMAVVIIGYVVVNLVIGSILEPRILGYRLGLSPLVVLLSLLFWGWIWGGVGLLLAVPLTMVAKILLEHSEGRWLATLLGAAERR